MRRISVLSLSVLALVGVRVGSASAKPVLELSAGGVALEVGTPIATSSSGMIIRTSGGNITCDESVMEGTVTANISTEADLQFTSATFRGTHHFPQCESTLALGEPTVTVTGLPWSLSLTKKGNGKFKGAKKGKEARARFTLVFPEGTCVMEGKAGTDAFELPLTEEPVPLELSLDGLTLKLVRGSGAGCPGSGTFEEPDIAVSDEPGHNPDPVDVMLWKKYPLPK